MKPEGLDPGLEAQPPHQFRPAEITGPFPRVREYIEVLFLVAEEFKSFFHYRVQWDPALLQSSLLVLPASQDQMSIRDVRLFEIKDFIDAGGCAEEKNEKSLFNRSRREIDLHEIINRGIVFQAFLGRESLNPLAGIL